MNTPTETDLRDALRSKRPEPDAFRRAIERKLAEQVKEKEQRDAAARGAWSAAASVLPVGLFHPALSAPALALGKKLGAKGLLSLLALPVLSIAMLALAFLGTLRAATRFRTGTTPTQAAADEAIRAWWKAHVVHALVTIALLVLLAFTEPAEAVVAVLLASMIFVTAVLTRVSRVGAASRASIGKFTSSFLGALFLLALLFDDFAEGVRDVAVADYWSPLVILMGSVACDVVGRWDRGWSIARKATNAVVPAAIFALVIGFLHANLRPPSEARLAAFVTDFDEPLTETVEWIRLGEVGEWLREEGERGFDLGDARRIVSDAWAGGAGAPELLEPSSISPSLVAAARLDLLPDGLWDALAERGRALLATEGGVPVTHPILQPDAVELSVRALARAGSTEEERERLSARLRGGWPEPDSFRSLENMAKIAQLTELLGRPLSGAPDAERYRDDAHDALCLRWRGRVGERPYAAAFVTDPGTIESRHVADLMLLEATESALELMQRFGVPESPDYIDVARVRAFLLRAATPSVIEAIAPSSIDLLTVQPYRYHAAVLLRRLMSSAELRPPDPEGAGLARVLVAERILVGSILLVLSCLFALFASLTPFTDGRVSRSTHRG